MGASVRTDRRTSRLYLDIHTRGRRRYIYTGLRDTPKNRRIIEVKAEEIEREMFLGTFDPAKHFPREERKKRVTFTQLFEEWRRKKANEVAPLTLQWYRETVEGKILPFWGSKPLDRFSPQLFDRFKAGLLEKKLSPRTVNVILMRLREMIRLAHERGYLKEDRTRWVILQKGVRPTIDPLSFEEKDQFLAALPLRWRPYFEVAFGTGLRPSEQIALKKDRIDWDRGKILVREGWRAGQLTHLKTAASHREVDILPAVGRALEAQRLVSGASELVFPSRRGGHITLGNLRRRVWYPALLKAGLRPRDLYNTRHTFATHALASGEDPGWVAKMLGHTTLTMLVTRYYGYVPNLVRQDGALLAAQLERRGPGPVAKRGHGVQRLPGPHRKQ
jgi:integrase